MILNTSAQIALEYWNTILGSIEPSPDHAGLALKKVEDAVIVSALESDKVTSEKFSLF